MIQVETSQSVPLEMDESGTIRVKESRVPLDTIVGRFKEGYTAEEIAESFPSLRLADIFAVLAYYLQHEAEVESYLQGRQAEAEDLKKKCEDRLDMQPLRDRLLARRTRKAASKA